MRTLPPQNFPAGQVEKFASQGCFCIIFSFYPAVPILEQAALVRPIKAACLEDVRSGKALVFVHNCRRGLV